MQRIDILPPDAWPRAYYVSELERLYLNNNPGRYPDELMLLVDDLLARLPEGKRLREQRNENVKRVHEQHGLPFPATTQSTQPTSP